MNVWAGKRVGKRVNEWAGVYCIHSCIACVRAFVRMLGMEDGNACGYCAAGSLWMHHPQESGMHSAFAKDDIHLRVKFTCDVAQVMA